MIFVLTVAVVTIAAVVFFVADQRRRGRFARFAAYNVDGAWLENLLLPVPPEVAGAALDDSVGTGEVKAILWRMTREAKVASDRDPFRLRLVVSRDTLEGAEAALVRALFVTGDTIDRESLVEYWKQRYELVPGAKYELTDLPDVFARKVFDPAREIEDVVMDDGQRLLDGTYGLPREQLSRALFSDLAPDRTPAPPDRVIDFMSWPYAALIALADHSRRDKNNIRYHLDPMFRFNTEVLLVVGLAMHLAAKWLADRVRRKPSLMPVDAIVFILPLLVMPVAALILDTAATARFLLALLFAGSMINIVFRARSGVTARQTTVRQDLARARDFLRSEVARGNVPEVWIPYLFALDVVQHIDVKGLGFDTVAWSEGVSKLIEPFIARDVSSHGV